MNSEQRIELIAEELKDICGEGRDIPNEYMSDVLSLIEAYKMESGSVDEWQDLAARRATRMTELMNEVDRLNAENEALKKDALRYRWIRNNQLDALEIMEKFVGEQMEYCTEEELDVAIDCEISEEVQP